jgi:hypothetical protein
LRQRDGGLFDRQSRNSIRNLSGHHDCNLRAHRGDSQDCENSALQPHVNVILSDIPRLA